LLQSGVIAISLGQNSLLHQSRITVDVVSSILSDSNTESLLGCLLAVIVCCVAMCNAPDKHNVKESEDAGGDLSEGTGEDETESDCGAGQGNRSGRKREKLKNNSIFNQFFSFTLVLHTVPYKTYSFLNHDYRIFFYD